MARKIDSVEGMRVLALHATGSQLNASNTRLAVRYALQNIAELHPGHAVEIRVPYAGAVQAFEGPNHRRGTPPNVIETDQKTFLDLVTGLTGWDEAMRDGKIDASGQRANLSGTLPMYSRTTLERIAGQGEA